MKAAIEAVANNKMNGTETWKKFGKGKAGRNTKLTPVEEQVLVNCCFFMAKSC